ncbi:SDR family NAD(P)-dependent oxidoreductase [Mesorhizobium sp. YM1C-6-2]|nr:SDR family NAD(P)-dependent oxidoreductase [Mesorhizobium sp. YM1C-6-2]
MSQNGLRPCIVVTGASNGIGQAMAKSAAKGFVVVLVGRSDERLTAVAEEIRTEGSETLTLQLDLLADNAARQVKDFLDANGLACHVLVNSAGQGLQGLAASRPLDAQLRMIDLNVRLLVELTLTLIPGMVARHGGGVINLGSLAGLIPGPQMAVYYATKSFVSSFSQALYEELRGTGVTVTCVIPGPVDTGFLHGRGIKDLPLFKYMPSLSAEDVAESAWRGFQRGRRMVVPGITSKLAALVMSLVPLRLALPVINQVQTRWADPCPCGSGKTFIRCCGMKSSTRRRFGFGIPGLLERKPKSPKAKRVP